MHFCPAGVKVIIAIEKCFAVEAFPIGRREAEGMVQGLPMCMLLSVAVEFQAHNLKRSTASIIHKLFALSETFDGNRTATEL
jgi:hypothetical protein